MKARAVFVPVVISKKASGGKSLWKNPRKKRPHSVESLKCAKCGNCCKHMIFKPFRKECFLYYFFPTLQRQYFKPQKRSGSIRIKRIRCVMQIIKRKCKSNSHYFNLNILMPSKWFVLCRQHQFHTFLTITNNYFESSSPQAFLRKLSSGAIFPKSFLSRNTVCS